MPDNTSIAIVAKIKTKYGHVLKSDDYKKLAACESLPEVVAYLKSSTHYKDALAKVSETTVHRGQLENILRQYIYLEYGQLCKYETGVSSYFTTFIKRNYEVRQIIRFLTLLSTGKQQDYLLAVPTYFDKHTEINFNALTNAKNYSDFLDALTKTPYEKLLAPFKPKPDENLQLPQIEDALYTFVFGEAFELINKYSQSTEKAELSQIFNLIIDFNNLTRIVRLKDYYHCTPQEIKSHLLPFGTLKNNTIEQWLEMDSSEEILKSVQQSRLKKYMNFGDDGESRDIYHKARFEICKRCMYFAVAPAATVLAFYFLLENEIVNIIHIVEAARYGFDRRMLDQLLIY